VYALMGFIMSNGCKGKKGDALENKSSSLLQSGDTEGIHSRFFASDIGDNGKENSKGKKKGLCNKFFLSDISLDD